MRNGYVFLCNKHRNGFLGNTYHASTKFKLFFCSWVSFLAPLVNWIEVCQLLSSLCSKPFTPKLVDHVFLGMHTTYDGHIPELLGRDFWLFWSSSSYPWPQECDVLWSACSISHIHPDSGFGWNAVGCNCSGSWPTAFTEDGGGHRRESVVLAPWSGRGKLRLRAQSTPGKYLPEYASRAVAGLQTSSLWTQLFSFHQR